MTTHTHTRMMMKSNSFMIRITWIVIGLLFLFQCYYIQSYQTNKNLRHLLEQENEPIQDSAALGEDRTQKLHAKTKSMRGKLNGKPFNYRDHAAHKREKLKKREKEALEERVILQSIEEFDKKFVLEKPEKIPRNVKEAVVLYQVNQVPSQEEFEGNADFMLALRMSKLLQKFHRQTQIKPMILVAGLNFGGLLKNLVQCLAPHTYQAHGFEIDSVNIQWARVGFANNTDVSIHQLGVSNQLGSVKVAGAGQTAGLYDQSAILLQKPHWPIRSYQEEKRISVPTVPLEKFVANYSINTVHYLTIDVEGHETCVLQGMQLDSPANQKMFSMFQMELGGTWVVEDPRHPVGSWTQYETMVYLEKLGYKLYLIGMRVLLPVTSLFFKYGPIPGDKGVVFGNVLVIHPAHAHPVFLKYVQQFDDYEHVKQVLLVSKYYSGPLPCEEITLR